MAHSASTGDLFESSRHAIARVQIRSDRCGALIRAARERLVKSDAVLHRGAVRPAPLADAFDFWDRVRLLVNG